jgi:CMP/dCMP kinase
MTLVVAVDGPAGSGKSSVSKEVARSLGFSYLDTGAGYRCVTWLATHRGVDLSDSNSLVELVPAVVESLPLSPDDQKLVVDGVDVTDTIRGSEVTSMVSTVAGHLPVRGALNDGFRALALSLGSPGIIIEGRDITTAVMPDAPVRVLLTASEEVRAARRSLDVASGENSRDMAKRDQQDSAVVDFMTPATGVFLLDTSTLDFDQSVQALLDRVLSVYSPGDAS